MLSGTWVYRSMTQPTRGFKSQKSEKLFWEATCSDYSLVTSQIYIQRACCFRTIAVCLFAHPFFNSHGHRPATYGPFDYFGEFGVMVQAIDNDANIPVKNNLIGPSVATGAWTPEMVWNTGFISSYSSSLAALAVEQQVLPPY